MASVDKVQISSTSYDVSPSPSGTLEGFASNDVADASATSYVSVNKIEATETNSSIFGKITSMIRNIRYLYNKLGTTTMPEDTVTGSISSLNTSLNNKAAKSHTHTASTLPVSSSQVNSTSYIPSSSLIYSMNTTLNKVVNGGTMEQDIITNIDCGGVYSGTSISSTSKIRSVIKNMLYAPQPSTEYESRSLGTWSSTSDVDNFFTTYIPSTGWDGLKIGNYITIQDGTYNVDWEIAGFNLEQKQTAADGTVYNNGYGLVMIPKTPLTTLTWNSSSSKIPYIDSDIHSNINSTVYNNLSSICGSHIINRNVLLGSTISDSSTGYTSDYTWSTAYLTLMSVGQLTNTFASHRNSYDDGEANYYLPLFQYENYYISSDSFWVRNVQSYSRKNKVLYSYYIGTSGSISYTMPNIMSLGIRPLMYMR